MNRRQRKRILIFLVIPIFAAILLLSDDILIRVITITLMIIYVAFIIFLRDSVRADDGFIPPEEINEDKDVEQTDLSFHDSFEIISKNKNVEVITSDTFVPEYKIPKTTLIPSDLKERFEEIANESVPEELGHDGQFTFVLEKMLTVIKEAFAAHTAIFFWYNRKKEKLSVEKFVSSSNEITRRKFDLEDDILSKIVQRSEPELLNDISSAAEADVIRYYSSVQGIRSFVGVPLFYDKSLIAILAVDSKIPDAFGIETIYSLGRFVRVITILIGLFEEKHSDTIAQMRLNGLLNLISADKKYDSESNMLQALEKAVEQLVHWDAFAFVYYHPEDKSFKTLKIKNKTSLKYVGEHLQIELTGTLVGKSVITGMPIKIDDTSSREYIRFSKVEDVSFDGSFIAIPLVYENQIYGVLCFESMKKNAYSNNDVQFLKNSLGIIAFMVHSYSIQNLLKNYLALDIDTKALNVQTFKERVNSELVKAEKFKVPGALALIRIDDFLEQESLFEGNPLPKVIVTVSDIISKEMTPFTIFGRVGEKSFGIYFFDSTTKDVFLWAEKLRVKIARKPIAVVTKQTTYTVSIGVASANNKTDVEEIIYNAELALQKALERGGNTVRSIN